jgi:hypothetical protein
VVVFTEPTWQSTKKLDQKRLADVQVYGLTPSFPNMAIVGFTIAQVKREVILYLPTHDRAGGKCLAPRMVSGTQTVDGETIAFMAPAKRGEREIAKLTDAIMDAWADANVGNKSPYNVELPLSL